MKPKLTWFSGGRILLQFIFLVRHSQSDRFSIFYHVTADGRERVDERVLVTAAAAPTVVE